MLPDLLTFIIASLACYRLAMLLSIDTGPARMFSKLRSFLKREAEHNKVLRKTDVHHGIDCLRCSSVWIAAPVAAYVFYHDSLAEWLLIAGDIFLLCMALSSASILWHRAFPKQA